MANKRVIDLSTLSETVQEGQYVLVDSSGGTGKMSLKKIVDDSTETLAEQVEQNTQDIENLSGDFETLEGRVDDAEESIAGKADDDGVYPDLFAGNLISDKMQTDRTPYLFRKTGGNLSRVGERCYDTVIGASVGENQLYGKTGNSTNKGITFTNTDGRIAISGVNDGTGTSYYIYNFTTSIPANHVVAFRSGVDGGSSTTYDAQLIANGGSNELSYDGKSYIVTKKNYPWTGCNLNVRTGYNADQNPITFAPEIIDLTQKFGSSIADYIYSLETATAGSGIAKLRSWGFLKGYQAYNAGSIESVEVTGKVVRGFNQWDEEWEVGGLDSSGASISTTNQIRSKNNCRCIGGESYYLRSSKTDGGSNNRYYLGIYWYDNENRFISLQYANNQTATAPVNAFYFKIGTNSSTVIYGNEYLNDICINLSSDRNGEYEAYTSQSYDYGDDTLRGIFKLDANNNLYADGDTKTSDGVITRRYALIDLGTLNYVANNNRFNTDTPISGIVNETIDLVCPKYVSDMKAATRELDKSVCVRNGGYVYIYDTAYSDANAFKTAMSGTYLVYPLAEPTTEQSTPFSSPQICYPDGTEEYITGNGVPVGHSTEYPYDLKGLVEELIDVPDVPSANGTYVLKATRSASGVAFNWVAG